MSCYLIEILEVILGRSFVYTNSNSMAAGKRKKTISRQIVVGPNAIKIVAIIICAILALVYLSQSTAGANRSVKVSDLDDKKGQLILEKERLEVEQTRLRSLKEIDNGIVEKNSLEPVTEVEHIEN